MQLRFHYENGPFLYWRKGKPFYKEAHYVLNVLLLTPGKAYDRFPTGENWIIVIGDLYDVLVGAGFFSSRGQAKKNWQRESKLQPGYNFIDQVPAPRHSQVKCNNHNAFRVCDLTIYVPMVS